MSESAEAAHRLSVALEEDDRQARERDADILAQLRAIGSSISVERRLADERHEAVCRKLDKLIERLSTNGSGGDHG